NAASGLHARASAGVSGWRDDRLHQAGDHVVDVPGYGDARGDRRCGAERSTPRVTVAAGSRTACSRARTSTQAATRSTTPSAAPARSPTTSPPHVHRADRRRMASELAFSAWLLPCCSSSSHPPGRVWITVARQPPPPHLSIDHPP